MDSKMGSVQDPLQIYNFAVTSSKSRPPLKQRSAQSSLRIQRLDKMRVTKTQKRHVCLTKKVRLLARKHQFQLKNSLWGFPTGPPGMPYRQRWSQGSQHGFHLCCFLYTCGCQGFNATSVLHTDAMEALHALSIAWASGGFLVLLGVPVDPNVDYL